MRLFRKAHADPSPDLYDGERSMAATDAMRDREYSPPSSISQLRVCFVNQLALYSKQRTVWTAVALVAAIPLLYAVLSALAPSLIQASDVANIHAGRILAALPIASMFMASAVCGSMLPQEYNERTVYMTLPLPVSRKVFYLGKFLAGFALCAATVCAAYGISIAISSACAAHSYTAQMLESLAVALSGLFSFCAFAYMLSTRMTRGSSIAPLVALAAAIPAACIILAHAVPGSTCVLGYAPVFAPDLALSMMGDSTHMSLWGLFEYPIRDSLPGFEVGPSATVMSAASLGLGALMLWAGGRANDRRDMR
jgi:ABC-type transport system involved in multi-copper enzyme maturation permease subunit